MKCFSCDKILSDFEATRKVIKEDGKLYYPELCNKCFKLSDLSTLVSTVDRIDLEQDVVADDYIDMEHFLEEQEYNEDR